MGRGRRVQRLLADRVLQGEEGRPEQQSRPGPGAYVFEDDDRVIGVPGDAARKADRADEGRRSSPARRRRSPTRRRSSPQPITHSVWYMPDVASCFAMRDMLCRAHHTSRASRSSSPPAAKAGQGADAKPPVEAAIAQAAKEHSSGSITLSCGKLMTGVTVREWGAILMLRSLKSPESYFQAAFRVQSPWALARAGRQARRPQAHLLRLRVRPKPGAHAASPSTGCGSRRQAT